MGTVGTLRLVLAGLAVLFIAAQLVPVDRTNPPVEREAPITADVKPVLEKACFDCHSHLTRWPWYAKVAPVSWLLAYDVHEGREHMNFSVWPKRARKQIDALDEIVEMVSEGEMPPAIYLPLHPEARLADAERQAIEAWAKATTAELETKRAGRGERQQALRAPHAAEAAEAPAEQASVE
jgi:hypothetical protein